MENHGNNSSPDKDQYEPWTTKVEKLIMHELERLTTPHTSLNEVGVFNRVVDDVAREVKGLYGRIASRCSVKRRIQLVRERFYHFLNYIRMPGVKFDNAMKRVEVDGDFGAT